MIVITSHFVSYLTVQQAKTMTRHLLYDKTSVVRQDICRIFVVKITYSCIFESDHDLF